MSHNPAVLALAMLLLLPSGGTAQEPELLTPPGVEPRVWGVLEVPGRPGPAPAVIVLYGSTGWRPEYAEIARRFADAGFVALALDYYAEVGDAAVEREERLRRREGWQQAVRNAARFLGSLPGVKGDHLALVGYSSGAFLAVSVGSSIPSVRAVVDFFGGGGGGVRSVQDEAKGLPPLLILHGDADANVPVSRAHELAAAVRAAGGDVEVHLFPGAAHAFNAWWAPTFSQDAADRSWDITLAFLRATLGG